MSTETVFLEMLQPHYVEWLSSVEGENNWKLLPLNQIPILVVKVQVRLLIWGLTMTKKVIPLLYVVPAMQPLNWPVLSLV